MKRSKYLLISICMSIVSFNANCQAKIQDLDFLIGAWKVENKESYEDWQKMGKNLLTGYGYKVKQSEKILTENLSIKVINDAIIYEATVPNQNNGKAIPFTLNITNDGWFSFENEDHDFPKKIRYKMLDNDTLHVQVLGENDQGFSYKLVRQEEK